MDGLQQLAIDDTVKMIDALLEKAEFLVKSMKTQKDNLLNEFQYAEDGPVNLIKIIMEMAVIVNDFKPDISSIISSSVNLAVTGGLVFMPIGSDKEIRNQAINNVENLSVGE